MPRLVPNPVGEIMQPLRGIEKAIAGLSEEMAPINTLPEIHAQLVQLNASLATVVALLSEQSTRAAA